MSKELKALKGRLGHINKTPIEEALECLENLCDEFPILKKDYKIINRALLKSQEQEKVLEVLKEKRVDLSYLRCCIEDNQSVERYNEYIRNKTMDYDHEEELTREEFNLLKRWICQSE